VHIGGAIAVIVVGAIIAFAVEDRIPGIDTVAFGIIVVAGGAVWLVLSLVLRAGRSQTEVLTTTEVTEHRSTGDGRDVIVRRTEQEVFTDDDA
jgi:predicted signal transduction protein with EAL and GGDEF domain